MAIALAGGAPCARALDPGKAPTQFGHDHWTMEDGLPVTSVEVLLQDDDGYLWVGDEEGLARFDGQRFTYFNLRTTPGLSNHDIRSLARRREGGLWVGTWRGLFLLEGGEARPVEVVPGNAFVVIESLFEDRAGALWAGTQGYGVVRLGPGEPIRYDAAHGLPGNSVWALQGDREGALWIGTRGGLARLAGGTIESFADHPQVPAGTISCFALAPDGSLWIGGIRGLSHYRDGRFRLYTPADGLPHPTVDSLALDRHGALWIGTRAGLARLHDGRWSYLGRSDGSRPDGLADTVVRALLEDREGSLWIGTESGGLERLRDGKFTVYGRPEGLADDLVLSILEDRAGATWFGTKRGLSRLAAGRVSSWTERDGLVVPIVTSLLEDRTGTLWVGTTDGLHRFARDRLVPWKPDPRSAAHFDIFVSALYEDPAGTLWVGTETGLGSWSGGRWRMYTTADGMSCEAVSALVPSRDGGFWIGTTGGGLMRYRDGAFTAWGPNEGLSEVDVYALHEDADGTLWVGTNGGGINLLRDGRIAVVSSRQGLFDDVVLQILDDGLGYLWLTSSRGVSRVEKVHLLEVAAGRRDPISPSVYDTSHGLRSAEGVGGGFQPAGWRAADGRLWFPTTRGAAVVDPRALGRGASPPPVRIEQLLVNGEPNALKGTPRLAPGSRRFEITYTALTFLAPDKVRFQVRLAGFDRDWVEMGNRRSAAYTNLAPGHYRFEVRAADADGVWSREGAALDFTLRPRFYQTPWFFALGLAAVVLAAGGAYRLRLGALRARFAAVLAERARIARELHDTVAQELVAASLQLDLAREELPPSALAVYEPLERSRALLSSCLAATRRSVEALRAPLAPGSDLPGALERLVASVARGVRVEVQVERRALPEPLPAAIEENLLGIAREALSNAVRHAQAQHIRLELGNGSGRLRLRVVDDGRGFAEAGASAVPGHFGLLGMRERASAMGGRLSVESAPGRGTVVEVTVPLPRGGR